jgi:hypothetical protein
LNAAKKRLIPDLVGERLVEKIRNVSNGTPILPHPKTTDNRSDPPSAKSNRSKFQPVLPFGGRNRR